MKPPTRILETVLYCGDLPAARHFYGTVLRLAEYAYLEQEYLFYRVGTGMLLVFQPDKSQAKNPEQRPDLPPGHGVSGAGHMAFAIEHREFDDWENHLKENQVEIESRVEWPEGGKSIYFRDPGANCVELATADVWP